MGPLDPKILPKILPKVPLEPPPANAPAAKAQLSGIGQAEIAQVGNELTEQRALGVQGGDQIRRRRAHAI